MFTHSTSFAQEGTKQLIPGTNDRLYMEIYGEGSNFATYNAEDRERLHVFLKAGEKMYFGMKMSAANGNPALTTFRIKDPSETVVFPQTPFPVNNTNIGFISSRNQAVAGPNGVILNGTTINTGYTPFVYTAQSTGDHILEFQTWQDAGFSIFQRRQSWLEFFDVTVTDAGNQVVTNQGDPTHSAGRLWSKQWALTTTSFINFPVKTDFFIYTADGFVNKVNYEMLPFGFIFVSNTFGVKQTADAFENRRSASGNAFVNDVSEHKIFLNNPDISIYPSSTVQPVVKIFFNSMQIYDYNYGRAPQELTLNPGVIIVNENENNCPHNSIATFKILSNIHSQIQIAFDLDGNNDGFTPGGVDRVLYADVDPGENYVVWDLKDGLGNQLGSGGAFNGYMTFLMGGITHFPLYDVEALNGVTTGAVRPFTRSNPTLFWDDQNINTPPSSLTLSPGSAVTQLASGANIPRKWAFNGNANEQNNGNLNTMNSWFCGLELQKNFQCMIVQGSTCKDYDHDKDKIYDFEDLDDDNDGIPDLVECPESVDPSQDSDNDGIPNYQDPDLPGFVDQNNDGVNDTFDRDKDSTPDFLDLDSDNDGISDVIEAGGSDPDNNGIINLINITDTDLDGLDDSVDPQVFGSAPGTPLPYPDTDKDGVPDGEDSDTDNDGIPDNREGQSTANYVAPITSPGLDSDADGLNDAYDLFFNQYNTSPPYGSYGSVVLNGNPINPLNTDNTDVKDYLDPDTDNDGAPDWVEGFDDNENGTTAEDLKNRAQNYESLNGNPGHYPNVDNNANNIPDWAEDGNNNGIADFLDPLVVSTFKDSDKDGLINLYDPDNKGKEYGTALGNFHEPDNDHDNTPNYRDIDSPGCLQTPLTTFSGKTVLCTGATLSLSADEKNAQNYTWRKGAQVISNAQTLIISNIGLNNAGNDYSLEVSNGICVLSSAAFSIQVFTAPDLSFTGNTTFCEGDTLLLTANQTSANAYTWRKDGTIIGNNRALQINHLTPGNASNDYTLEIDNGSCSIESDSIRIQVLAQAKTNLSVSAVANNLCASNQGAQIRIQHSESGVSYQLFEGSQSIGQALVGNDSTLTLLTGVIPTPGTHTYTVKASRGNCKSIPLTQTVNIQIDALPQTNLSVKADRNEVCNNNTGISIQLENSESGVSYQLAQNGAALGNLQNGNGATLNFATGPITAVGNLDYTILAFRGACSGIALDTVLRVISGDSAAVSLQIRSEVGSNGNETCGGSATFTAIPVNAGNAPFYEWFVNGNSVGSGGTEFNFSGLHDGDKIKAKLTSSLPCTFPVFSNEVSVVSRPPLNVKIEADIKQGIPGCILTLKASGAQTYTWEPLSAIQSLSASGDVIEVNPTQTTTFIVNGQDQYGCSGQDSVVITIVADESLFIPTLFSPNGDTRNDRFLVHGQCIKEITLKVFDRAGNLVYEANTIEQATKIGWDGTHNGANQPMGKYLWTLEGKSTTGKDLQYEGKTRGIINLFR